MPLLAPALNIIRCASSIKANIIFLDSQPTLGLLLLSAATPVNKISEEIGQIQSGFTHSFVVVYGSLSDDKLTSIQLAFPCGTMRFYSTPNIQTGVYVIPVYYTIFFSSVYRLRNYNVLAQ